jgi:hypothetical protein
MKEIIKQHKAVLIFTLIYLVPFTIYFVSTGKGEFIWYSIIVLGLFFLVFLTLKKSQFSKGIIWGLSFWALLHLAGGGLKVGAGVLYGLVLIPIYDGGGEMILLKYDQAVHAFGFGLCAYIIFHFLKRYSQNPYRFGVYMIAVLAGMGLGAVNEIAEFIAVILFPDNGVGGYVNTALDLVFNSVGAILVMAFVWFKNRKLINDKTSMNWNR